VVVLVARAEEVAELVGDDARRAVAHARLERGVDDRETILGERERSAAGGGIALRDDAEEQGDRVDPVLVAELGESMAQANRIGEAVESARLPVAGRARQLVDDDGRSYREAERRLTSACVAMALALEPGLHVAEIRSIGGSTKEGIERR